MIWELARETFLQRKANNEDPLIVRLGKGAAPRDANDFIVVDRISNLDAVRRQETLIISSD